MQITVDDPPGGLSLSGRLSASTVGGVRDALADALADGTGDVVVDMSGVELIDATGLGVLVGAHRRAQHVDRRLVLRALPERIDRLLIATRLHRVLTIEERIAV